MLGYYIKRYPLLFLGTAILVLTLLLDYFVIPGFQAGRVNNIPEKVKQRIAKKSAVADSLLANALNRARRAKKIDFKPFGKQADQYNLKFYVYYKSDLVFWNTNKVLPKHTIITPKSFETVDLGNGKYLQKGRKSGPYKAQILLPIKRDYPIQNKYLKSKLLIDNNVENYYSFNIKSVGKSIVNKKGEYLFSLKKTATTYQVQGLIWPYLICFILLLFGFTRLTSNYLFARKYLTGFTILIVISILFLINVFYSALPSIIFNKVIFNTPASTDTKNLFAIGDYFLLFTFITLFIHYLTKHFQFHNLPKFRFLRFFVTIFLFTITVLGSHYLIAFLEQLVLSSDIYLNVNNFKKLDIASFFTIITIFLFLYNLIVLSFWFYNQLKTFIKDNFILLIGLFLLVILVYQFLGQTQLITNFFAGLFSLLIWLGFLAFYPQNPSFYAPLIYLILISAGFTSIHLLKFSEKKALKHQKRYATQVTYQRDAIAEELFTKVSREIKNDQYARNYFLNPLLPKNFLKRRIQKLYFSRYLNKYNFKLHTYKYGGIPYKGKPENPLSYYHRLIDKYGLKASAKNLYYINKTGSSPSYLALYHFQIFGGQYGTIVIELKRKIFYEDRIYPSLLLEGKLADEASSKPYDYAIYKNEGLISQKGDYPYKITDQFQDSTKIYKDYKEDGYHHLLHQVSHNAFVIVTRNTPSILNELAVFSFIFIIFFLLSMISLNFQKQNFQLARDLLRAIFYRNLNHFKPFRHLLFQRKIQLIILLTALLVMVTVGVSTVNYLHFNFSKQLNKELSQKTKKLVPKIEQFLQDTKTESLYNNKADLFAKVKTLTQQYQTDINIYNAKGSLITSSQPRVYEKGILSAQMNPEAYQYMNFEKHAQLIQEEQIGELNYLASYAPLRDSENRVIGFINLPYFSKQPVLQQEISSLIITLVNLYVLIFLVVIIVSLFLSNTLTRPLDLIRDKLRKTQLGKTNEKINWEARDELGQLINEYNQMVDELERNADTLAKSEREGAWREMARQVAHEIKNPLTPMKLNIQRLQQRFPNSSNADHQEVQKVGRILTQQIDHLSKIATDFSAFAQLSQGEPQSLEVNEELAELVDFFNSQNKTPIKLQTTPNNTRISIDRNHFNRILTNLIKNALEAIPEQDEGKITINTCYTKSGFLCLWISDNGKGIPSNEHSKVFQPNFSTKNSGTGLGLAMIKKMVNNANGHVTFTSEPGKGTTFYLYFPLA